MEGDPLLKSFIQLMSEKGWIYSLPPRAAGLHPSGGISSSLPGEGESEHGDVVKREFSPRGDNGPRGPGNGEDSKDGIIVKSEEPRGKKGGVSEMLRNRPFTKELLEVSLAFRATLVYGIDDRSALDAIYRS